MRLCLAGLIASAQTSMSFACARASPQITEFFDRRAISWTLSKSPWLAMGKPASMMSTPISSSSSATSSFSSKVIVAPGHCSPSRKVVSKITTRSFPSHVFLGVCSWVQLMFSSSSPWLGSLARPASRLNYRGFVLPSPERRPRFNWRERRCSGASKEEFGEDDGRSERGGRQSGASSKILLFAKSLHRSPVAALVKRRRNIVRSPFGSKATANGDLLAVLRKLDAMAQVDPGSQKEVIALDHIAL